MKRSSGIIMHISSLPSKYGIGTLGKSAFQFADFLAKAGQSYWQMLPMGPTGYGNSPYQSFSAHAGNPYFIDLEILIENGMLSQSDVNSQTWGEIDSAVDYKRIHESRIAILRTAYEKNYSSDAEAIEIFLKNNDSWLPDYALYMALKIKFGDNSWLYWPDQAKFKHPGALEIYRRELKSDIDFYVYLQFLFFKQWDRLKGYINDLGIKIIGDLPIYVAVDSADVWSSPSLFALDSKLNPRWISGVPPDYFSQDGQLWGNPVYKWTAHREKSYAWWISRIQSAEKFADIIRIDHFRGIYDYWRIPSTAITARKGKWVKGPGNEFIQEIRNNFPKTEIIAEDLGLLSKEAMDFVASSGFPGMKVLQFSFDASKVGVNGPHTFRENSVCYTGTHDNTTVRGWFSEGLKRDVELAKRYLGLNEKEGLTRGFIRGGMACPSQLFITQMQDWLDLDESARMNIPGTVGGNWQWRLTPGMLTDKLAREIAYTTRLYGRSPKGRRK